MAKPITPEDEYKPGNQQNGLTVGPADLPVQFKVGQQALAALPQALSERGGALTILPPGQNQVEDFGVTVPGKATYWENPQRVARYANAMRAGDIEDAPPWLDKGAIDTAYKYLEFRNEGKPWYRWEGLAEDDPGTAFLRSITSPPAEVMPNWEQKESEWSLQEQYQPSEQVPGSNTTFGVGDAQWDALPWWQKALIPVMSSGPKFGAVLGGALGMAGGPVGAATGAALGSALGAAGEGAQKNPNAPLAKAFTWLTNAEPDSGGGFASGALDWGAEIPERLFGMATQLGYAAIDPDRYGTVGEIIKNLPQAWQAATMLYTVFPSGGPGQQLDYLKASLGSGRDNYRQKVWNLGQPEPVYLSEEQVGAAAMAEVRGRLSAIEGGQSDETLEGVFQDMRNRFGFTGQRQELMSHMILDLYNLIPLAVPQMVGDIAKAAKNPMLKAAADIAKGEPGQMLRAYQILARQAPVDELGGVTKWLAGITTDETGAARLKWMQNPSAPKGKFVNPLWWTDATPRTKAFETTVMFRDNAIHLLNDVQSVDEAGKLLHIAANGAPQEVAQVSHASWLNSAEGGVFPMMMREHVNFVDELVDAYKISDPKRTMLNNLADVMGSTPAKLLDDISDAKGADSLIKTMAMKLDDLAKNGDTKAADLLRSINDPANPMTGAKLYNIASDFKRGNFPLTFDEWKYKVIDLLSEKVEGSAAKWFDVKPDRWLVRLGNAVKSAQSLVLLGLNPSYLINNFINNIATMVHSGVFGLEGATARASAVRRMGLENVTRLGAGMGAAEVGDIAKAGKAGYSVGDVVSKASRPVKADTITKFDDLMKDLSKKTGLATKWSAKIEGWSSEIAYTTALRKTYRNLWKPGDGFKKMDGVLEQALRGIDVDPDAVYRAMSGTMNHKEIEEAIANGYKFENLDRALSPESKQLFDELGIYDALTERMRNAKTKDDIVRAIDSTRKDMFDNIGKKIRSNLEAKEEAAFNRVKGEGVQAVLEEWDRLWMEQGEFWMSHHDEMGHVFEVANQLTGKNRSKYLAQKLQESEDKWRLQWENQGAKVQGAVRALSENGSNVTTQKATDILINQRQNWQVFYDTRSKLWNLFSEVSYGKDQGALIELNRLLGEMLGDEFTGVVDMKAFDFGTYKTTIDDAMSKAYRDHLGIETGLQVELDGLFVDMFGRQFENAEAAAAWRAGILNLREMMAEGNIYFRTGDASGLMNFGDKRLALKVQIDKITGGRAVQSLTPTERHAMYRTFNEQVTKPMISRYMQENMVNSGAMAQATPRPEPIPPAPIAPSYQEMPDNTVLTQVPGTLLRAYMDAEGYEAPRHMINAYNKYMQPEQKITKLDDLTWGDVQKLTAARKEIKAAEAGAVEVTKVEAPKALLVDENDKPIVVRHFTDAEFDIFDKSKLGMNTLENANDYYLGLTSLLGFWFTDSDIKIFKRSVPANLEMKNPLYVEDLDELSYLVKEKLANKAGIDIDDPDAEFFIKANLSEIGIKESDVINELVDDIRLEHDGIIVDSDEEFGGTSYIVFDPEQIVRTDIEKFSETTAQAPEPEAVRMPLGEVEKYGAQPIDDATLEGWNMMVEPAMRDLEAKMLAGEGMQPTGGLADQIRAGVKRGNPEATADEIEQLTAGMMKQVRAWVGEVKKNQSEVKLASQKWGQAARDFALLNYDRRTNFDTAAGLIFPYEFWYTRSMLNWAQRAIDRPAIFANYARLKEFQQGTVEREGFPFRLSKKVGIRLPFLPEWMGEGVFVDPYRVIFPFSQFGRPVEALAEQKNLEYRKTVSTLQQMAADEEIGADEAQQAIETGSGALWDKARAQALSDIDQEIANPFDFISLMYGPSLPIQYAYQMAMGRPERISQLPITRGLQAVTGALGIGGPGGINPFGKIRKSLGMPENDQFYDYRVNRMLASMTAQGEINVEDAKRAMVYQEGPAFEEAQRKVAKIGFWQYIGAPVGLDFFPEGEQEQRALRSEYDKAIEAWKNGDNTALAKFDDKYPEYEAQRLAWKSDPEEQLRAFLRSEVWDGWYKMPDLYQQQAKEQLGSTFADAFLNKETRSYDSIDTATYAMWARMLGGDAGGVQTAQMELDLADRAIADKVQEYNDERDKLFPNIGEIYNLPEIEQAKYDDITSAYTSWKQNFIAKNPQIAEYVTGEQSNIAGLPPEVQGYVYQYRASRDNSFPGIFETQEKYYSFENSAQKKAFLKQHPELSEYWDMRTQWAAQMPAAAPYILGEESLRNRIDPQSDKAVSYQGATQKATISAQDIEGFDPALTRQLFSWAFTGEPLTRGARDELYRQWELQGKPGTTFEKYLLLVKDAVR